MVRTSSSAPSWYPSERRRLSSKLSMRAPNPRVLVRHTLPRYSCAQKKRASSAARRRASMHNPSLGATPLSALSICRVQQNTRGVTRSHRMQNTTRPNCIESSIVLSVKAVESCAKIHVMATFPSSWMLGCAAFASNTSLLRYGPSNASGHSRSLNHLSVCG